MRQGKHNDSSEVSKLQTFLNHELGLNMPVTGFFGSQTTAGVNAFQTKYQDDVLGPWASFGGNGKPTGYVYKTTERKINLLSCASLNIPEPQLP
jgi:peptidoglycan hydrolase-like protein with peptidoglycan-binding domain